MGRKRSCTHMHNPIASLALAVSVLATWAQDTKPVRSGLLAGHVVDLRTRIPVSDAQVRDLTHGTSVITDSTGRYRFGAIPIGYIDLEVRVDGYHPEMFTTVFIKPGVNREMTLAVRRNDQVMELPKMTVRALGVAEKRTEQSNSVVRLSRDDVLRAPGAIQDPNRIVQTLPSAVAASADGWNTFLVRGGEDNENLFVIDGIETRNISHWGTEHNASGALGFLHPDFISSMDFYAGGMPAYLPCRLSSVTDIHLREGSMADRTWQIDLGIAGAGLLLEGPVVRDKVSYLLNARLSFLDIIEPLVGVGGLPKYQNGHLKVVWKPSGVHKLALNSIVGHEEIHIAGEDGNAAAQEEVWDEGWHVLNGLSWDWTGARAANRLLVSGTYNRFIENAWLQDTINTWRWTSDHLEGTVRDDVSVFLRDNDVLSLGAVFSGRDQRDIVGEDTYHFFADTAGDSSWHYLLDSTGVRDLMYVTTTGDGDDVDTSMTGYRIGGHASYTMDLGRVKLQAGIRDDYYTLNRKHGPSPRGSASLSLGRGGEVSLSGGTYHQFPAYVTSLTEWNTEFLRRDLQRNTQVVLGYSNRLCDAVYMSAEGYCKYYDREPLYSITADSSFAGAGQRSVVTGRSTYGVKRVYGLELFLQKRTHDWLYYQVAYSLFSAERRYENGKWYDDDYNLRNAATLVIGSQFHRSHRIACRMDFTEGMPYTPVDVAASTALWDTYYDISDGWNSKRRDFRFVLSLRYDLTLYFRRTAVSLYLEVENLFDNRDIVADYLSFGDKYPEREVTNYKGRGILPQGGLTVTF